MTRQGVPANENEWENPVKKLGTRGRYLQGVRVEALEEQLEQKDGGASHFDVLVVLHQLADAVEELQYRRSKIPFKFDRLFP